MSFLLILQVKEKIKNRRRKITVRDFIVGDQKVENSTVKGEIFSNSEDLFLCKIKQERDFSKKSTVH